MAWAERRISTRELLLNWVIVCAANFAGAVLLACAVFLSGHLEPNGGAIGRTYVAIARRRPRFRSERLGFSGVAEVRFPHTELR